MIRNAHSPTLIKTKQYIAQFGVENIFFPKVHSNYSWNIANNVGLILTCWLPAFDVATRQYVGQSICRKYRHIAYLAVFDRYTFIVFSVDCRGVWISLFSAYRIVSVNGETSVVCWYFNVIFHHPFYFYIKFKRYYSVRVCWGSTVLHVLDTSTIKYVANDFWDFLGHEASVSSGRRFSWLKAEFNFVRTCGLAPGYVNWSPVQRTHNFISGDLTKF